MSVFFWEKMLKVGEFNPLASGESEVSQAGLQTYSSLVLHFRLIDWEYVKHSVFVPESAAEEDQACNLRHFLKRATQVMGLQMAKPALQLWTP